MSGVKAYIFEYEKVETRVCAYSAEMFSAVLRGARKDETAWVGGEVEAHEDGEGRCACETRVATVSEAARTRLRGYQVAVVGLELVAVGGGERRLLVCEMRVRRGPTGRCRVRAVTAGVGPRPRGQHCLLALTQILLVELSSIRGASAGRNNSLSTKATIFKDCYKEVAKELAGKGALPSAISQKSLHSRDNNRCWFDYGRIMDICIHYKLSAKDIAELIKHIASIDPMQPDPIICIKDRFGTTGHHNRGSKKEISSEFSDSTSSSQISSHGSSSSSSGTSELLVSKSRSSSKLKNKINKLQESTNKRNHHRSKSHNKSITKETQTSNCTQSETQTEFYQCECFKVRPNQKLLYPPENERYINKYHWSPNYYDDNEYEEPTNYDNECIEEPLIFDDQDAHYLQNKEIERNPHCIKNDFQKRPPHSNDSLNHISLKHSSNYEDGDYDSQIYDDFLRQSDYIDNDEDFDLDIDQPHMYNGMKVKCSPEGRQKRLSSLKTRLQKSRQVYPHPSANNPSCIKYSNGSYNVDQVRSTSQPVLQSKNQSFRLVGNSSNSQEHLFQSNLYQNKLLTTSKSAVDSCTQTLILSSNDSVDEACSSKLKKSASESNLCQKTYIESNVINSTKDSDNVLSHVGVNTSISLNTSKTFKMGFAQTDFNNKVDEDLYQSHSQQGIYIPKFMYKEGVHVDYYMSSPKRVTEEHNHFTAYKALSNPYAKQSYESQSIVYNDDPFPINRNANNHSISRSPSGRNSQTVEVDNENMEKISSVIVDHESRPIVYYDDKEQNNTDYLNSYHVDYNPFYERNELFSEGEQQERANSNINNSIKSVTVCNKESVTTKSNICSIPGCQNIADDCNYKCVNHGIIRSSSCSPERCLSRLSCIISLNRQFVDHSLSPEEALSHQAIMRRVIYEKCDETNCAETFLDVIPQEFERCCLINDILPVKSQKLKSITCKLLKVSNHDPCPKRQYLFVDNSTIHSSMKVNNKNMVDCNTVTLRPYIHKSICKLKNIHCPAQIMCQSLSEEMVTPKHLKPDLISKKAAVKRTCINRNSAAWSSCPLSNIGELTNAASDSQFYLISRRHFQNLLLSKNENSHRTENNYRNKARNESLIKSSCDLKFPLNLQVCPVSGCKNITTTGQPLCCPKDQIYRNCDKPDSTKNNTYVCSPYLTADSLSASYRSSHSQINHGQEYDYDDDNNEILSNDNLRRPLSDNDIHVSPMDDESEESELRTPRQSGSSRQKQSYRDNQRSASEKTPSSLKGPNSPSDKSVSIFDPYKGYDEYDIYPSEKSSSALNERNSLKNPNSRSTTQSRSAAADRNFASSRYYDSNPANVDFNRSTKDQSVRNSNYLKTSNPDRKSAVSLQFGKEENEYNRLEITPNQLYGKRPMRTSRSSSRKTPSMKYSDVEDVDDDFDPSDMTSGKLKEKSINLNRMTFPDDDDSEDKYEKIKNSMNTLENVNLERMTSRKSAATKRNHKSNRFDDFNSSEIDFGKSIADKSMRNSSYFKRFNQSEMAEASLQFGEEKNKDINDEFGSYDIASDESKKMSINDKRKTLLGNKDNEEEYDSLRRKSSVSKRKHKSSRYDEYNPTEIDFSKSIADKSMRNSNYFKSLNQPGNTETILQFGKEEEGYVDDDFDPYSTSSVRFNENSLNVPKMSVVDDNIEKKYENIPSIGINGSMLYPGRENESYLSSTYTNNLSDSKSSNTNITKRESNINASPEQQKESSDNFNYKYSKIILMDETNSVDKIEKFKSHNQSGTSISAIQVKRDNEVNSFLVQKTNINNLIQFDQKFESNIFDLPLARNINITNKIQNKIDIINSIINDKDRQLEIMVMEPPQTFINKHLFEKKYSAIIDTSIDGSQKSKDDEHSFHLNAITVEINDFKSNIEFPVRSQISNSKDPHFVSLDNDNFPKPSTLEVIIQNEVSVNDADLLRKIATTNRLSEILESVHYNNDINLSRTKSIESNFFKKTKLFIKNISTSSKHTMENEIQKTHTIKEFKIPKIPISTITNHSLNHENDNNFLEGDYLMNNSSFIDFFYNNKQKDFNYLYLDYLTTHVRSRVFSDTIIFKDPDCFILGKCEHLFYSTPELIQNRQLNRILVSERWDISSDLILENVDSITLSLPALIDHPNNKVILLISLSVLFLFCKQIPILLHCTPFQYKKKESKIIQLFRSIRKSKSQPSKINLKSSVHLKIKKSEKIEKIELLKDFKNKMVKIVKKCKNTTFGCQLKSSHASTFSTNLIEDKKLLFGFNPSSKDNGSLPSYSLNYHNQYSPCTQSCIDFGRIHNKCEDILKFCKSEPIFNKYSQKWMHSTETILQRPFSSGEISTADLSLLCGEVLKKIKSKYVIDSGNKNEIVKPQFSCIHNHSSSKDTLQLIIKALKYLHRSQLEDSGPSNKTLDSVSSIKTCSGDCLDSITSSKTKTIHSRNELNDDKILISAFNKTF